MYMRIVLASVLVLAVACAGSAGSNGAKLTSTYFLESDSCPAEERCHVGLLVDYPDTWKQQTITLTPGGVSDDVAAVVIQPQWFCDRCSTTGDGNLFNKPFLGIELTAERYIAVIAKSRAAEVGVSNLKTQTKTIAGRQAAQLTYDKTVAGSLKRVHETHVLGKYISRDGREIGVISKIVYKAIPDKYDEFLPVVNAMVKSIRFN